ncbi:hypothetical protein ACWCPQ_31305 [Nocardia sp. NPDC001965]
MPTADTTIDLAGFAKASYSTLQNVLQHHSAGWHGADGTAATITQRVATVGAMALQEIKDMVCRLQDVLNAADLDSAVPASYTERSSAGDELSSFAEYRIAVTVERTLEQADEVVSRAQADLGIEGSNSLAPVFPTVPEGIMPPRTVPMPERQRHPQGPTTLEV